MNQAIRCIVSACDETCPHYWSDGVCHGYEDVAKSVQKGFDLLKEYSAIGTAERFRELEEKATPKKVADKFKLHYPHMGGKCPTCGLHINNNLSWRYCECGQRVDWT